MKYKKNAVPKKLRGLFIRLGLPPKKIEEKPNPLN